MKAALKDFVQQMVKGRDLSLRPASGKGQRVLKCRLTPDSSSLVVGDANPQNLRLIDILHIHRGFEAVPLNLEYELDANMVVLELSNGSCVTFQFGNTADTDEFALYFRMLHSMQRQRQRTRSNKGGSSKVDDDDDNQSVCSVQTGLCQKQMTATPMSTAVNDPKEVKKMFKMFNETMRRGKDFYVLRAGG